MALHSREKLWEFRYTWYNSFGLRRWSALIGMSETKHFIYFYLGHNAILLFKTQ
jgi:hypothetical protein